MSLFGSKNKQGLLFYTALTDFFMIEILKFVAQW